MNCNLTADSLPPREAHSKISDRGNFAMSGFVMNSVARVVVSEGMSPHRFGGSPVHKGNQPQPDSQPLHLLYTFDTRAPLFPISVPGVRYLPLYYGFIYNAGAVNYRVLADDEIEILYLENERVESDFPYPDYPAEFPQTPVSLVPVTYEQHKTLVFFMACEDFSVGETDMSEADQQFLKDSAYPFTQLGGIQRMRQGIPEAHCYNKNCENYQGWSTLDVFAVVWSKPVPDVFLWSEDGDDDSQVIFQICSHCHSIYVSNRCT